MNRSRRQQFDDAEAPVNRVVISERNRIGEAVLGVARDHAILIRDDSPLAGELAGLDIKGYIPPEMYRAVAEVLSWVYKMENGKR